MSTRRITYLQGPGELLRALPRQAHFFFDVFPRSLLSERARLIRFAATGLTCGAAQILILHLLEASGWNAIAANATGLLLSSELNFILSYVFTWGDRGHGRFSMARIAQRWVMFHGSIAGTGLLNLVVFSAMSLVAPSLLAALAGIGVGGLVNFLLNDNLVFRLPTNVRRRC